MNIKEYTPGNVYVYSCSRANIFYIYILLICDVIMTLGTCTDALIRRWLYENGYNMTITFLLYTCIWY